MESFQISNVSTNNRKVLCYAWNTKLIHVNKYWPVLTEQVWESDPGYVTNIYLGGVHEEHLYVCLSIGGADKAARGGAAAATSYMVAFDNRLS